MYDLILDLCVGKRKTAIFLRKVRSIEYTAGDRHRKFCSRLSPILRDIILAAGSRTRMSLARVSHAYFVLRIYARYHVSHITAHAHTNEIFHNGGLAEAWSQNGSLITTVTAINPGMRGWQKHREPPSGRASIYGVSKLISHSVPRLAP